MGQVPSEIPSRRPGKRINVSTVWRWVMHGCRGIRLETLIVGGGRYTSRQAVQRFAERLSAARAGSPGPARESAPRTASRRARDSERAGRELEQLGA
jgi:hypothetical protein